MIRLDLLLLERGLASTRTKAQELIDSGAVKVHGRIVRKSGEKVSEDCEIELLKTEHPYVSRGGLKLEAALESFGISVEGVRALDVGQSTGGFTHCLLLKGAKEVVGVDVGADQIAVELRQDPRVRIWEKTDIRSFSPESAGAPFEFFVVDLSFISLQHILPVLPRFLAANSEGVVLVKPQFEVGRENVGSGGIVRDNAVREGALQMVERISQAQGFTVAGKRESPVTGGDGNVEFLLHLKRLSPP